MNKAARFHRCNPKANRISWRRLFPPWHCRQGRTDQLPIPQAEPDFAGSPAELQPLLISLHAVCLSRRGDDRRRRKAIELAYIPAGRARGKGVEMARRGSAVVGIDCLADNPTRVEPLALTQGGGD